MRAWDELMRDYRAMSGVLDFTWFEDVPAGTDSVLHCVRSALEQHGPVDAGALAALRRKRLTPAQFLGSWFDDRTKELIFAGSLTTKDGHERTNPPFAELQRATFLTSGSCVPEGPGEFAYAFANPPYSLGADYPEIARLFEEFRQALLAGGDAQEIDDFGSDPLPAVSAYFDAGAEWWGTYLWTIYDWQHRRVCVILGSATD